MSLLGDGDWLPGGAPVQLLMDCSGVPVCDCEPNWRVWREEFPESQHVIQHGDNREARLVVAPHQLRVATLCVFRHPLFVEEWMRKVVRYVHPPEDLRDGHDTRPQSRRFA